MKDIDGVHPVEGVVREPAEIGHVADLEVDLVLEPLVGVLSLAHLDGVDIHVDARGAHARAGLDRFPQHRSVAAAEVEDGVPVETPDHWKKDAAVRDSWAATRGI